MLKKLTTALLLGAALVAPTHAAQLVLINTDPPGVGFNDPTPVAPVGGNTGTTLGEQRLIAYNRALTLWGSTLRSNVPIRVQGSFQRLNCTAAGGTLASAGALSIFSDFPNAPLANRWYGGALADALAGEDLDPGFNDIIANFNGDLGQPNCIPGPGFYYGFDHNVPPGGVDFINTFMHEVAHGLGFQNFANEATGGLIEGRADVYMAYTRDLTLGRQWDQLTPQEIVASAVRNGQVVWSGQRVNANAGRVLGAFEGVRLFGTLNREIVFGTASFGALPSANTLNGPIVLADDGTAPTANGCEPFINNVAGQVVLVDRGVCGFAVKAKNAQNAGALAVVIANNVEGAGAIALGGTDPTITIASIGISLEDGNAIKAALPGVSVEYFVDPTRRSGSAGGLVRLFAPTVVQLGSSISHFDTVATPNLLMEPAITGTLRATRNVDLTPSLMQDIGWRLQPLAIGSCNTGVPNALATGQLLSVDIEQCIAAPGGSASVRRSCISRVARTAQSQGLLTKPQASAIEFCGNQVP